MRSSVFVVTILTGLIFAANTFGYDAAELDNQLEWWQSRPGDKLAAGLGLVISPKPYKKMDSDTILIPMILYERGKLTIRGKSLEYELFSDTWWTLSGVLDMRFDGYDDDDSSALSGMDDREWTLDGGLAMDFTDDVWGKLRLGWLTDIMGRHQGHELGLRYSYPIRYEKFLLNPNVGFELQSSDLTDYYYGVRDSEARAGRPGYSADSTINWIVGLGVNYKVDEKWSLYSNMELEFYGDEIRRSPIVDESYGFGALFGVMYSF